MTSPTYPLTMPSSPKPMSITFGIHRANAETQSPYNGTTQIQEWPLSYLIATVQMPPIPAANAGDWLAFFAKLHGRVGTFYLPVFDRPTPQASPGGSPVVSSISSDGLSLTTSGWGLETANQMLPGDFLQLPNGELKLVVDPVTTVGTGTAATVQVEPRVRDITTTGALITANCKGKFSLVNDISTWDVSYALHYGFSFQCREAVR